MPTAIPTRSNARLTDRPHRAAAMWHFEPLRVPRLGSLCAHSISPNCSLRRSPESQPAADRVASHRL